jgi:hypothetical protein
MNAHKVSFRFRCTNGRERTSRLELGGLGILLRNEDKEVDDATGVLRDGDIVSSNFERKGQERKRTPFSVVDRREEHRQEQVSRLHEGRRDSMKLTVVVPCGARNRDQYGERKEARRYRRTYTKQA